MKKFLKILGLGFLFLVVSITLYYQYVFNWSVRFHQGDCVDHGGVLYYISSDACIIKGSYCMDRLDDRSKHEKEGTTSAISRSDIENSSYVRISCPSLEGPSTNPKKLSCKNVNQKDFFEQFERELDQQGDYIRHNTAVAVWDQFFAWTQLIKDCTDGAFAEGIENAWERGVSFNFPGFLSFYRSHPELKKELDYQFGRVYHPDPDGVVDVKSRELLLKELNGKCPPELKEVCLRAAAR